MKVLATYDYGFKKYLGETKAGYTMVFSKKEAKAFSNEKDALEVKMTLANKEEFFIETI